MQVNWVSESNFKVTMNDERGTPEMVSRFVMEKTNALQACLVKYIETDTEELNPYDFAKPLLPFASCSWGTRSKNRGGRIFRTADDILPQDRGDSPLCLTR
jgi:hypothetical protein